MLSVLETSILLPIWLKSMDLQEAKEIALGLVKKLDWEPVELGSALGRVVAEPITADHDIPGNPRSKWDGFAMMSADCQGTGPHKPVILEIARGETAAGKKPGQAKSGRCFRIMTGGVLPEGTDAVIPFEDSVTCDRGLVVTRPLQPGSGVIAPGSEAQKDDLLLGEGEVFTPTKLALAASTGRATVRVTRRPRVAVLATGDELKEAGRSDESASIFCNNTHLFANLVRIAGAEAVELGAVPDDPVLICSRLENADANLVITTGGMGKGSRDFMFEVWKRLGLRTHFDRLNLVPGKGSALASDDERIFLGLPGNPRAGGIVYEEIAAPLIRRFLGLRARGDFVLYARTLGAMKKKGGSYQAFEGVFQIRGSACIFIPNQTSTAGHQKKASSFRSGMAYSLLAPGDTYVTKGKMVEVKVPDLDLLSWAILNICAAGD
jgi:molybdenum cofactor synthesis domain-containing protein